MTANNHLADKHIAQLVILSFTWVWAYISQRQGDQAAVTAKVRSSIFQVLIRQDTAVDASLSQHILHWWAYDIRDELSAAPITPKEKKSACVCHVEIVVVQQQRPNWTLNFKAMQLQYTKWLWRRQEITSSRTKESQLSRTCLRKLSFLWNFHAKVKAQRVSQPFSLSLLLGFSSCFSCCKWTTLALFWCLLPTNRACHQPLS